MADDPDLLRRVNDDVQREQIRARQEQDMWHAVGHEIMSPLQSLLALHGDAADPSRRYLQRMQQALSHLIAACEHTGQELPCPIIETLAADFH